MDFPIRTDLQMLMFFQLCQLEGGKIIHHLEILPGFLILFKVFFEMIVIWVNYNDLTTTSLGIMVSKGNHPQMGLIQVSELL